MKKYNLVENRTELTILEAEENNGGLIAPFLYRKVIEKAIVLGGKIIDWLKTEH